MIRDREVFEPCDAAYEVMSCHLPPPHPPPPSGLARRLMGAHLDGAAQAFLREKQYPTVTAGGRIAHECGLGGVAPASWVENITGLMPGTGALLCSPLPRRPTLAGSQRSALAACGAETKNVVCT